jgi:hypothetical protein
MVRYTGRQKTITGAVNRNQVGLKMSGCPSRVGRSGKNLRLLGRRVNCMYGLCGPTMVNGAPWRTSIRNFPPYCRQRSTACAQAAGGVGHINSPYTRTRVPAAGKQGCTPAAPMPPQPPWWFNNPAVLAALSALSSYLASQGQQLALLGKSETLQGDIDGPTLLDDGSDHLYHYFDGATDYNSLITARPDLVAAIGLINSIGFEFQVPQSGAKISMIHTAGGVTAGAALALRDHGIGFDIDFGSGVSVKSYGAWQCFSDDGYTQLKGFTGVWTGKHWAYPTNPPQEVGQWPSDLDYSDVKSINPNKGGNLYTWLSNSNYLPPPYYFRIENIDTGLLLSSTVGWKIYWVDVNPKDKGLLGCIPYYCGCTRGLCNLRPTKGCTTMYYFDLNQGTDNSPDWRQVEPPSELDNALGVDGRLPTIYLGPKRNNMPKDGVYVIPGNWRFSSSWRKASNYDNSDANSDSVSGRACFGENGC